MYKQWIDEIMSTEKLPEYEFSPFPKPTPKPAHRDEIIDEFGSNVADKPTLMALIVTLLPVLIFKTYIF